jgi:hypothetical protein
MAGAEGAPTPELPIPLIVLGVWESISALSVLALLFLQAALIFGVILHGWAAVLVVLTHSLLSAYAAWTIFRQELIGWQISIFKTAIWTVSMLVTYLHRPDILPLLREMGYNSPALRIYEQSPQLLSTIWLGSTVIMIVLIVFVLYARRFFPRDARTG